MMEISPVGKSKSKPIDAGTVFGVPLLDGTFAVSQIADWMDPVSARCFLFDVRVKCISLIETAIPADLAVCKAIVMRARLDDGTWPVGKTLEVKVPISQWPFEETKSKGWIGAPVITSLLFEELANAWFGLKFWDDWYDHRYLDKFLMSADKRSDLANYKHC